MIGEKVITKDDVKYVNEAIVRRAHAALRKAEELLAPWQDCGELGELALVDVRRALKELEGVL